MLRTAGRLGPHIHKTSILFPTSTRNLPWHIQLANFRRPAASQLHCANNMPARRGAPSQTKSGKTAEVDSGDGSGAEPSDLTATGPNFFLIKSEPDEYSIDDLASKPNGVGQWDGIRNFRARNLMRTIKLGEQMFFYHSSCKEPGIVGIAELVREAYPDHQSWDPHSKYFDAKSTPDNPRWFMMDIKFVRRLKRLIPLTELKSHAEGALEGIVLLRVPRLSVQPVSKEHWDFILSLEELPAPEKGGAKAGGGVKGRGGKRKGQEPEEGAGKGDEVEVEAGAKRESRGGEVAGPRSGARKGRQRKQDEDRGEGGRAGLTSENEGAAVTGQGAGKRSSKRRR